MSIKRFSSNRLFATLGAALALGSVFALTPAVASAQQELNVYSARKEHLIKPLLDAFSERTGVQYNLLTADTDQLIARMKQEGRFSPADLLITTDAGRLYRAQQAGLFQSVDSEVLNANVPDRYRDPSGEWFGLSLRARVVFYDPERVDPAHLSDYMSLANDRWEERICIRSSNNIYNQSLLASLIAHYGEEAATDWAASMVDNMARKPQGGDRDQLKAVAAGECDLAVANTYYYGGMLTSQDEGQRDVAESLAIFWPGQEDGDGAHVNISGAGVAKHAKNQAEAIQFLEYMTSVEAQTYYAESNHEYPIRQDIEWPPLLREWGMFTADDLSVAKLGEHNAEAVRIFDRVGWR